MQRSLNCQLLQGQHLLLMQILNQGLILGVWATSLLYQQIWKPNHLQLLGLQFRISKKLNWRKLKVKVYAMVLLLYSDDAHKPAVASVICDPYKFGVGFREQCWAQSKGRMIKAKVKQASPTVLAINFCSAQTLASKLPLKPSEKAHFREENMHSLGLSH